jgi:sigma-B regulation protein RsbU (phosphoserine phosphatase)
VDLAVETMRRGVRDFVQKPWDNAQLLATLRSEIDAGRERRRRAEDEKREIEEARRIQRKLLPSSIPLFDGCEIATQWRPASGVGGDCYDVIPFGPSRLALCIADVVGKGIPAALLMSNLQASVRAFASDAAPPAELCGQVNRILCGRIAEGRFISFFYCRIDTTLGIVSFANAGHYLPILIKQNGSVERLVEGGPVLGVFPDASYSQEHAQLASGDRILLFTDGVTEARNGADEEFGEDRLIEAAVENRACSALHSRLVCRSTWPSSPATRSRTMRR